jgi:hypothetical protein
MGGSALDTDVHFEPTVQLLPADSISLARSAVRALRPIRRLVQTVKTSN